jgi:hypothetical protein
MSTELALAVPEADCMPPNVSVVLGLSLHALYLLACS